LTISATGISSKRRCLLNASFLSTKDRHFTGQFTQEKSLADLRAEYEELAGEKPS
jgi:hypothetical protein